MLLEAGADSNVVDKEGNTLLHMIGRRVQPASGMFSMGDEIQARRHGLKTWFFGTIGAINEDGTYKINGTKTGYPFKPWLEQLEFKYMGGDKNTRHFANKYLKAEDKEHCRQQLAALCEKFGWQLVAY